MYAVAKEENFVHLKSDLEIQWESISHWNMDFSVRVLVVLLTIFGHRIRNLLLRCDLIAG